MDWDKLKIFHAVAEAGSFTNATINLNLVNQTVDKFSPRTGFKVQLFRGMQED